MASTAPNAFTQLLVGCSQGDQKALDALIPLVYDELRRLARSYMRRERHGRTLRTTILVHDAYLCLLGQDASWVNRSHFFGIAAKMMCRILLDHVKATAGRSLAEAR
jgi:RNA polymerase sigma factor (TIGR02999 family)